MKSIKTWLLLLPDYTYSQLALGVAVLFVIRPLGFLFMHWRASYCGEKSKLVYQETETNKMLLSLCPSISAYLVSVITNILQRLMILDPKDRYYPSWRLFTGHLQTLRFAYDDRGPKIRYRRQLLQLPDTGVVSLDWALLSDQRQNASTQTMEFVSNNWLPNVESTRPTAILLPGLTGGSFENYIRKTIARLHQVGWQCLVLNARGCANTPLTTAQLFSSAYTEDLRFVLHELGERYAFASHVFIGVGFSMGSNVLVKYLGENGHDTPLTGAISIGNPFDLTICAANFSRSLFHRMTYDQALNHNLRDLFFHKSNAAHQFQNHPSVDLETLRATRSVRAFDDALTKLVFQYDTVDAYYKDAGSGKLLGNVRVPLLCINAEDDPISIRAAIPNEEKVRSTSNVILCTTKSGGHLAFYESSLTNKKKKKKQEKSESTMWTVNPIVEFAEAVRQHKMKTTGVSVVSI
ncbi:hypothetical protein PsorP6_017504 [Peronosclerospora sorghi]|uniref:Uncharacterized protein n=1 Tax=Peronosclerospora sorghi TaxID=230839 RepID=A0ACC0WM56_9STRA|nr:hypothetical protein PsorP6_017504 [Peronosclerospora sorghi]